MKLFRHTYYNAHAVFARSMANVVTLIWTMVVLYRKNGLDYPSSSVRWLTEYVNEDLLAGGFFTLAVIQLFWLYREWPPIITRMHIGDFGYALFAFWWMFVAYSICLFGWAGRPVYPLALAAAVGMAGVSFVAFYSNPRDVSKCIDPYIHRDHAHS